MNRDITAMPEHSTRADIERFQRCLRRRGELVAEFQRNSPLSAPHYLSAADIHGAMNKLTTDRDCARTRVQRQEYNLGLIALENPSTAMSQTKPVRQYRRIGLAVDHPHF